MSNGGGKFTFFQFEAATGVPYVSCKLYHYAAGTTTDKDIWTDEAKTTAAAQPIVGDSRGIVTFYADGDYKFVLKDSSDNTLYTWDNVRITSDSATMWENNHGTAYPTAAAANIWQLFAKHTAGNVLQEIGINNGSSFVPLVSIDSNPKYAADTGVADAYLIAPSPSITAYTAGQKFYMKAINANTGASTINVNSLGLKNITKDGATALTAGDILAAEIVTLVYDGTQFQLQTALRGDGTVNTNLNADMVDGKHYTDLSGSRISVYKGSTSAIATSTYTKVSLDTEDIDTGSEFDATTNYRFTATVAGYYHISLQGIYNFGTAGLKQILLYKNGAAFVQAFASDSTNSYPTASIDIVMNLSASDYLEMYAYQTSGGNLNLLGGIVNGRYTFMSIYKLS